jgi:hypothetical protein
MDEVIVVTAGPAAALLAVYAICGALLIYNAASHVSVARVYLQLLLYVCGALRKLWDLNLCSEVEVRSARSAGIAAPARWLRETAVAGLPSYVRCLGALPLGSLPCSRRLGALR